MSESSLATYLKNHLSGSAAELELAQRAASSFAGTPEGAFLAEYIQQIEEDRSAMGELLRGTGSRDDTLKKIGRWAMERVVVSRLSDFTGNVTEFSRLVLIEGAVIGCLGRQRLWEVLEKANKHQAVTFDFPSLRKKAEEHERRLQQMLLSLAERAFQE